MVLVLENHERELKYLEAGQILGWIYNAKVYPEWEVDGEVIMRVDTSQSSVSAVPEISVNLLIAESDSY